MKTWVTYVLLGASAFWGPELVLTVIFHRPVNPRLLTALLPIFTCTVYMVLLKMRGRSSARPSIALTMLVGVFLLGPWCMAAAAAFAGSGSAGPWVNYLFLLIFSFIPVYTLMMSVYDLSFFALGLASIFLISAHFVWERHHWVLPIRRNRIRHAC